MPNAAMTLGEEIAAKMEQHRDRPFLEAAMAACALIATADRLVTFSERVGVERILEVVGAMGIFDPKEAVRLFEGFVDALDANDPTARHRALERIRDVAGDAKSAELLLRVSILISEADGHVVPAETDEIIEICRVLDVDPAVLGR